MISGIYEIVAPSGSRYIGSAINFYGRWRQHRHELKKGTHHNQPLQRATAKYGIENLIFRKLLVCRPEDLIMFEQRAIDILKPEYNASPTAGSMLGFRHKPETRLASSLARRGKKQPEELIRKRVARLIGHTVSLETRAKIGAANSKSPSTCFEMTASTEVKQQISQAYIEGERLHDLAQEYRADHKAIHRILVSQNVAIRPRGHFSLAHTASAAQKSEIVAAYEAGIGQRELSEKWNSNPAIIRRILVAAGVKIRPPGFNL